MENLEFPNIFLHYLSSVEFLIFQDNTYKGKRFFRSEDSRFVTVRTSTIVADKIADLLDFDKPTTIVNEEKKKFKPFSELVDVDGNLHSIKLYVPFELFAAKRTIQTEQIIKPLYCYFPTGINLNSALLLHGPFELTIDRSNIKATSDSNRKTMTALVDLLVSAIDWLASKGYLNTRTWELLPIDSLFYKQTLSVDKDLRLLLVRKVIEEIKAGRRWMPTIHKDIYCSSHEAVIAKAGYLNNLFSDEQLSELLSKKAYFVFEDAKNISDNTKPLNALLQNECKVKVIDTETLLQNSTRTLWVGSLIAGFDFFIAVVKITTVPNGSRRENS